MNRALCNTCGKLVPCQHEQRGDEILMVKTCPDCGETTTLVSTDVERYRIKHDVDTNEKPNKSCALNCLECKHKNVPSLVFLDITNRCNLNCPICINNTPSMGFLFEPPLSYFEKVFDFLATFDVKPGIQLFGGEPTVREDLFEIIEMAKARGLTPRVVTNGIKLANEDYCRRLVESRATICIAYDGDNPETYRVLRGSAKMLDRKVQAIDNIGKVGRGKVTLMSLVAKDFNDKDLPALFQFCHDRRNFVRAVYFMPLAHTWDEKDFELEPERITTEDIEHMVDGCFPDDSVIFLPAGFFGQIPMIVRLLINKPLPFGGAHANCESMYILLSDGEKYVPISRFLKGTLADAAKAMERADKKFQRIEKGWFARMLGGIGLRKSYVKTRVALGTILALLGQFRLGRVVRGRGLGKLWHGACMLGGVVIGTRTKKILEKHSIVQGAFQMVILPFEDKYTLETERLERCPSAFAYYDPQEDRVYYVPVCAWPLHKDRVFRMVSEYYEGAKPQGAAAT